MTFAMLEIRWKRNRVPGRCPHCGEFTPSQYHMFGHLDERKVTLVQRIKGWLRKKRKHPNQKSNSLAPS